MTLFLQTMPHLKAACHINESVGLKRYARRWGSIESRAHLDVTEISFEIELTEAVLEPLAKSNL